MDDVLVLTTRLHLVVATKSICHSLSFKIASEFSLFIFFSPLILGSGSVIREVLKRASWIKHSTIEIFLKGLQVV